VKSFTILAYDRPTAKAGSTADIHRDAEFPKISQKTPMVAGIKGVRRQ
jgi:hypothetical protein